LLNLFFGKDERARNTPEVSDNIGKLLHRAGSADLAELMSIWRGRDLAEWSRAPEVYRSLGERILAQGEPLLAFDVVTEGLSIFPNDVRLRQLQGLALARSGATERANAILEGLRRDGQTDEETLGMLGRTCKDLAANAASAPEREKFLRRAAETYAQAYQATGGYWTGINAATMNLLIGEKERACEIANVVRAQCFKAVKGESGNEYWLLAALGEAALILQDWPQAEEWYERAAKHAGHHWGDIHSSWRNARLILQYWNEDQSWIDKYLHIPSVIVFAGHMIDRPTRPIPRFPSELETAVAKSIRARIDKLKPGFGFASAACGSDILFLEAMLESGAEVSIVLPCAKDEFICESVDFVPSSDWRERFDRVLARAARVVIASNQRLMIGGVSYDYCNQILLGLATIHSARLNTSLIPLAVWDGTDADGPGGTESAVQRWRNLGYKPTVIELALMPTSESLVKQMQGTFAEEIPTIAMADSLPTTHFGSRILAILFADAVHFSKLTEPQVPQFVQHFLGAIAKLIREFKHTTLEKKTWGDGLFFVFSSVEHAGSFALDLAEMVANTDWTRYSLSAELNLRIALHAGPVYEFDDPITGERSYGGTHVNRAARMEPITPWGQVYASEAFAALAAAQGVTDFVCDYVGQTPMAKGYGTLPTYYVRRAAPVAARL